MGRPNFQAAWSAFARVNVSVAEVGKLIGGKVEANIADGTFANACPIRISYVLNETGSPMHRGKFAAVSGRDHKWYFYRVSDMMDYLPTVLGRPDKVSRDPRREAFAGMQGIVALMGHGWEDAKGHITLWNGVGCQDTCHLAEDPDNGTFVPEIAKFWSLP